MFDAALLKGGVDVGISNIVGVVMRPVEIVVLNYLKTLLLQLNNKHAKRSSYYLSSTQLLKLTQLDFGVLYIHNSGLAVCQSTWTFDSLTDHSYSISVLLAVSNL